MKLFSKDPIAAVLPILVSILLVYSGVQAASTISTNIATDGDLTIGGNTTLSSLAGNGNGVVGVDDDGLLSWSSGGGATTLQSALDNGFTLNKNNDIDAANYQLSFSNLDNLSFSVFDSNNVSNGGVNIVVDKVGKQLQLDAFDSNNDSNLKLTPTNLSLVKNGVTKEIATVNYKVYTALLTQTGTDAPVATVLENTLGGNILWNYNAEGYYIATATGLLTSGKVGVLLGLGTAQWYWEEYDPGNSIDIQTYTFSDVSVNNKLNNSLIEIRVYP